VSSGPQQSATASHPSGRSENEVVALAERQNYLRGLRLGGLLVICLVILTDPAGRARVVAPVWPAIIAYVEAMLVLELAWWARRRSGRGPREVWLLTWMLLVDAMAQVWCVNATGGLDSPLRDLVFVQVVAVVLLSSYRTGVKLAVWYCLLFIVDYYRSPAHLDGVHAATDSLAVRDVRLATYLIALVLITLVAAGASAISERELRRRRLDLESLSDLASAMERSSEPGEIAGILLTSLADAFDLKRLVLLGAGHDATVLARSPAVARDVLPVAPGERSLVTRTITDRAPRLVRALNATDDPWLTALLPGARNLVAVPLTAEGGSQGVLVFEYNRRPGSRMERRMLAIVERFAAHTALSLRNALLLERMRRVAAVDGLTRIPNRRTFEEELERESARASRTGEPVSLIMIDIDHFKILNDTHGHQVGDDVLQQVASILRTASREYDVVARYGGEEFAVIVPSCGREEAAASADRLLTALRQAATTVPVTASLGFATYPDDASSSRRLVDRADQALYAAKRAGRDRIAGYPEVLADQMAARSGIAAGGIA
jgi:diguanylate cyclase (GGDEF)-like protein